MNLTLFLPLCGRLDFWSGSLTHFLANQYWVHQSIKLVFCDTSGDEKFGEILKEWLRKSDYPNHEYIKLDCQKPTNGIELNTLCCDIYNIAARISESTLYTWIVEDDTIPPLNAGPRLVSYFDDTVGSCSGVYRHKIETKRFMVWNTKNYKLLKEHEGVHEVLGTGFGCVLMRSSIIHNYIFKQSDETYVDSKKKKQVFCYDHQFWDQVKMRKLVDWSVKCKHLGIREW